MLTLASHVAHIRLPDATPADNASTVPAEASGVTATPPAVVAEVEKQQEAENMAVDGHKTPAEAVAVESAHAEGSATPKPVEATEEPAAAAAEHMETQQQEESQAAAAEVRILTYRGACGPACSSAFLGSD